ncbi:hypothetical protein [Streptomyces formicae]|uniref:DUF3558 domain-containing protein n=1 Tax=Streptomyces formicae TaxID=1616117 RepID=A0A291QM39_9ACTN|nr:hypothetical protein [Streptomyces formicae]ATL32618.1 hypothetical protein KY5_7600c [Streptomyces formicae]
MSENPQVDPRQGFGEAHQGPGQAPPPMPGQAPPPAPPAPGAPSAWSQPIPAGGPGNSGPGGGRSRAWLIGGAAALAVAVIVGVVVVTTGDDDKDTASGKPPGVPGGVAKPKGPADEEPSGGKAYSKVPDGCELIKASTIEKIAPGGTCTPSAMDKGEGDLATMMTRMPRWEPADYGGPYQSLSVSLTVGASVKGQYDLKKRSALSDLKGMRKVEGSRPVSGLGQEALVVDTVDAREGTLTQAEVVVMDGNASLSVQFTYSRENSDTTRKQADDAVVTAARDVLGSLS